MDLYERLLKRHNLKCKVSNEITFEVKSLILVVEGSKSNYPGLRPKDFKSHDKSNYIENFQ